MFVSLWNVALRAQETPQLTKKELILGVNLTGNSYYGDINYNPTDGYLSPNTYLNLNPGVHVTFRQNQPNYFSMVLTGGYAQILAQNPDLTPFYYGDPTDPRSLYVAPRYVSTDYLYTDINGRFSPVRNVRTYFRPYVQAGAGALLFFPVKNGNVRPKGQNLERGESFSTISLSTNAVIGTDINLSKRASLNLGTQVRLPMTDYMDWYGGKNVNSFRKQSGDLIFSIMMGANFKIFETNRPTIFQPRVINHLQQEKLPEDSIVLASIQNGSLFDFWVKKNDIPANYFDLHIYPPDQTPLAVLAKSIDCDSLARIADQRISVLYAENLQLRAQYTKIENKTNNPSPVANNGDEELKRMTAEAQAEAEMAKLQASALKEANQTLLNKVSELESQMMAMQVEKENNTTPNPAPTSTAGNEDSLIRVILQREKEIADLQEILKQGPQTTSLAGSERLAELEKQNVTLTEENKQLREGKNDVSETPGFVELQGRYNAVVTQNESLQNDLQTAQADNQALLAQVEKGHNNEMSHQGNANKEIDSLKRETLTLYTEMSNQANAQNIKDSLAQVQVEEANALLATANARVATLEAAAPSGTNPSEVEGIQQALAEALKQKNETDAKYAELQTNLNKYEEDIIAAKQSNDSLTLLVQNLPSANPTTNPNPTETASVREESLKAELEEVRAIALKAQEDKNMAEENLTLAKTENASLNARIDDLKNNGNPGIAAEFQIAKARIDSLERDNVDLANRLAAQDPGGTAPMVASSVYQNLQAQLEARNNDVKSLDEENQTLKQTIASISTGTDGSAMMDMRSELDAVKRENANLVTLTESQKSRITDLEEKANNALPIIAATTGGGEDSLIIAALKTQIAELEDDKTALVNRNGEMQQEISLLQSGGGTVTPPVATISPEDYEKMKQNMDILTEENRALKEENERKQTQINSVVQNDPEERSLQIQQLENENTLLRQQVTKFATLNSQMADMQNRILELETENKNYKAIASGTPSDAAINAQLAEKEETISALQTQLADISTKYDAQKHDYDLLVAAGNVSKEAELTTKLDAAQAEVTALQSNVVSLKNENDSLLNNNGTIELLALKPQVEELRTSNAELLKKLNDTEDKVAAQEEALANAEKAYTEITGRIPNPEAINELETKIKTLEGQLSDANAKVEASTDLDAQVTTLKAQLAEDETSSAALKTEIAILNGTIAEQKGQLENNRPAGAGEVAILNKEIERLNDELKKNVNTEEAQAQIADLTEKNIRQEAEIQRLQGQVSSGISSEEIKGQMLALQSQNNQKQAVIDSLQALSPTSVANPSEAMAEMEAENTALKGQISEKESQNSDLAAQVQTLNLQLSKIPSAAELAILQKENERLNGLLANGGTGTDAALQAQVTGLQADKDRLTTDVATLNEQIKKMSDEGGNALIPEMQAIIAQKEDEIVVLNQKIANLPSTQAFAELQVKLDEALKNTPIGTGTEAAQIAALQADKETLLDKVGELTRQIDEMPNTGGGDEGLKIAIAAKTAEIDSLNAQLANTPNAEEVASLKVRNESLTAQLDEQENQMMDIAKRLSDLEEINGDGAAALERIAALEKELSERPAVDVTTYQVQIQNLTAENERLKTATPDGGAEVIAGLQTRVQALETENERLKTAGVNSNSEAIIADLNQQIQALKAGTPESGLAEIVASLRTQIANQEVVISQFKANPVSNQDAEIAGLKTEIETKKAEIADLTAKLPDANTLNIVAERDAVRKQNEEIFNENEDYRNALGAALIALDKMQKGTAPSPELSEKNTQLAARVSELETALTNRSQGGTDDKKLAEVQEQLNTALASNKELNDIIAKGPGSGSPDSEQVNQLKAEKNDLENQIRVKVSAIENLTAQAEQQTATVSAKEQEIAGYQKQITDLQTEIRGLRQNAKVNPISTNNIDDSPRVDSLKLVISTLEKRIIVLNTPSNVVTSSPTQTNGGSGMSEQQLNQKIAEIEAREKRSKAREEYIESLNLDYQLQVEKGKYLNAKEIESQILAQKLSGFPDYFAEITQDGAPCSTVSASLDKPEVMERINSYFNTLGYKFRTSNGKMIFENVSIPEISKKPVNVVFYMMTSKSGKRIFQGVFQFVDNKNYITADRYPNETTRVLKLMQRLSQQ